MKMYQRNSESKMSKSSENKRFRGKASLGCILCVDIILGVGGGIKIVTNTLFWKEELYFIGLNQLFSFKMLANCFWRKVTHCKRSHLKQCSKMTKLKHFDQTNSFPISSPPKKILYYFHCENSRELTIISHLALNNIELYCWDLQLLRPSQLWNSLKLEYQTHGVGFEMSLGARFSPK